MEEKEQKKRKMIDQNETIENKNSPIEINPFSEFKITTHDYLDNNKEREECPNCKKKCKWYCCYCYNLVGEAKKLNQMNLPLPMDM